MLALSPLIALGLHLSGVPDKGSDYRAVERVWRAHTKAPLQIVGSTTFNGIVFYFKDQASTLDIDNPKLTPWVSVDRIRREGGIIVCPETDAFCMRAPRGYGTFYSVVADENAVVVRRFFGVASVRALRDHRHPAGPFVASAQRHGTGTLTLHLRWGSIVRWRVVRGEVGVF